MKHLFLVLALALCPHAAAAACAGSNLLETLEGDQLAREGRPVLVGHAHPQGLGQAVVDPGLLAVALEAGLCAIVFRGASRQGDPVAARTAKAAFLLSLLAGGALAAAALRGTISP